jgi:hypothetical protein
LPGGPKGVDVIRKAISDNGASRRAEFCGPTQVVKKFRFRELLNCAHASVALTIGEARQ